MILELVKLNTVDCIFIIMYNIFIYMTNIFEDQDSVDVIAIDDDLSTQEQPILPIDGQVDMFEPFIIVDADEQDDWFDPKSLDASTPYASPKMDYDFDIVSNDDEDCEESQSKQYIVVLYRSQGKGGTSHVKVTLNHQMPIAKAPTKDNHIFVGYYDSMIGGTQYYNSTMHSTHLWDKPNNSILYARFVENGQ